MLPADYSEVNKMSALGQINLQIEEAKAQLEIETKKALAAIENQKLLSERMIQIQTLKVAAEVKKELENGPAGKADSGQEP